MPKNGKDITIKDLQLKVLVYGEPGSGKTTFASTFPKPYFFDFDEGLMSVRGKDFLYDTFKDTVKNGVLVKTAISQAESVLRDIENGKVEAETLVVDSITAMQDSMLRHVLKVANHKTTEYSDWKSFADNMLDFFMRLIGTGKHVVLTAHTEVTKDEISGRVYRWPYIMGNMTGKRLNNIIDEVYYAQVEKAKGERVYSEYSLLTRAGSSYHAKSRIGVLDDMEVPDFEVIMRKVQNLEGVVNNKQEKENKNG